MARKSAIPNEARRLLAIRYGCSPGGSVRARCAYCRARGRVVWHRLGSWIPSSWVTFQGLEIDHVVAEAAGGPSTADNLTLACRRCNRSKGVRSMPRAA